MIDRPDSAASGDADVTLVLPDGATRTVPRGTLPADVVRSIGERLLNAAVAVSVDGEIQDLMTPLRSGGAFKVLTDRDPAALAVLRHSAAHVLATAVRRLRPDAKIGFGPAIDDGFYYDFEVAKPFTPEDLDAFEAEMKKVVAEKYPFVRAEVDMDEARKRFADDPLKLERLDDFTDPNEIISTYTDGPFIDLCRGPHVPDTGRLKHFKLLTAAGAYWRGDEKRQDACFSASMARPSSRRTNWIRASFPPRKRRRSETIEGWGRRSWTCSSCIRSHRVPRSGRSGEPRSTNLLVDYVRERQARNFAEIKTPLIYNKGAVGDVGALGEVQGEHVPHPRQRVGRT